MALAPSLRVLARVLPAFTYLAVLDVEVGAARQEVLEDFVARFVGDDDARLLGIPLGAELGDLLLDVAGILVDLFLKGGAGDDILIAHIAVVLGDDGVGEGVEGGYGAVGGHHVAHLYDSSEPFRISMRFSWAMMRRRAGASPWALITLA
jgi:hypothetical protein